MEVKLDRNLAQCTLYQETYGSKLDKETRKIITEEAECFCDMVECLDHPYLTYTIVRNGIKIKFEIEEE
jgi:hypothetical protein